MRFEVAKPPPLNEKLRKLWQDLNAYIHENGGWIITQRDISPIRFECQPDSNLPTLLREAGHRLFEMGSHERLVPSTIYEQRGNHRIATTSVSPGIVSVWQFELVDKPKPEDPRKRMWTERLRLIEAQRQVQKPKVVEPEQVASKRWKKIPPEIQEKVRDELRKGTRPGHIAKMFGIGERSIGRIKATMNDNAKTSA